VKQVDNLGSPNMRKVAKILVVLNRLITMYISLNFQVSIMLVLYSIFLICPFDVGFGVKFF
jgi:hypothetical protein